MRGRHAPAHDSTFPCVGDIILGDYRSAKSLGFSDPDEKKSSLVPLNSPKGNKL